MVNSIIKADLLKLGYGYLWWIINEEEGSFAALGQGGKVLHFGKGVIISKIKDNWILLAIFLRESYNKMK